MRDFPLSFIPYPFYHLGYIERLATVMTRCDVGCPNASRQLGILPLGIIFIRGLFLRSSPDVHGVQSGYGGPPHRARRGLHGR